MNQNSHLFPPRHSFNLRTESAPNPRLPGHRTHYTDPNSQSRTWEHAERPTRPASSDIDAVGIVAVLTSPDGVPSLLLQRQFRPPLARVTIEVPAGLVDEGESAAEAAVRELREETGYVGTVAEESFVMFNDPGFCNTNTKMIHVDVDMGREENRKPVAQLEDSEFIETFTAPLSGLWEKCMQWEKEGYAIDARVGGIAEGIEVAKRWNLFDGK